MEIEVEIYWNDLSQEKQEELIRLGYNNENVISGVFPLIVFGWDEED